MKGRNNYNNNNNNKVDKENCTPDEVHEKVFDLMFELLDQPFF